MNEPLFRVGDYYRIKGLKGTWLLAYFNFGQTCLYFHQPNRADDLNVYMTEIQIPLELAVKKVKATHNGRLRR